MVQRVNQSGISPARTQTPLELLRLLRSLIAKGSLTNEQQNLLKKLLRNKTLLEKLSPEQKKALSDLIEKYQIDVPAEVKEFLKTQKEPAKPTANRADRVTTQGTSKPDKNQGAQPTQGAKPPKKVQKGSQSDAKDPIEWLGQRVKAGIPKLFDLLKKAEFLPAALRLKMMEILKKGQEGIERELRILQDPKSSKEARVQAQNSIKACMSILGNTETFLRASIIVRKLASHRRVSRSAGTAVEDNLGFAGKIMLDGNMQAASQILKSCHAYLVALRAKKYRLARLYLKGLKNDSLPKKLGLFALASSRTGLYRMRETVRRLKLNRRDQRSFSKLVRKTYGNIHRRLRPLIRSGKEVSDSDLMYLVGQIRIAHRAYVRLKNLAYQKALQAVLKKLSRYERLVPEEYKAQYAPLSKQAQTHFERALSLAQKGDMAASQKTHKKGQQVLVHLRLFLKINSVLNKSHKYVLKIRALKLKGASAEALRKLTGRMYSKYGYGVLGKLRAKVLSPSPNLQEVLIEYQKAARRQMHAQAAINRRLDLLSKCNNALKLIDIYLVNLKDPDKTRYANQAELHSVWEKLNRARKEILEVRGNLFTESYRKAEAAFNRQQGILQECSKSLNLEINGRAISHAAKGILAQRKAIERDILAKIGNNKISQEIKAKLAALEEFTAVRSYSQKQIEEFNRTASGLEDGLNKARVLYGLIKVKEVLSDISFADLHYGTGGRVLKNPLAAFFGSSPTGAPQAKRYRVRSALDAMREMNNPNVKAYKRLHQVANALHGYVSRFAQGNISAQKGKRVLAWLQRNPVIKKRMAEINLGYGFLRTCEKIESYLLVGAVITGWVAGTINIPFFNTMMEGGFKKAKWYTIAMDSTIILGYAASGIRLLTNAGRLANAARAAGSAARAAGSAARAAGFAARGVRGLLTSVRALRSVKPLALAARGVKTVSGLVRSGRALEATAVSLEMANTAAHLPVPVYLGFSVYDNWDKTGKGGKILGVGFTILAAVLLGKNIRSMPSHLFRKSIELRAALSSNAKLGSRIAALEAELSTAAEETVSFFKQPLKPGVKVDLKASAALSRKAARKAKELSILLETLGKRGDFTHLTHLGNLSQKAQKYGQLAFQLEEGAGQLERTDAFINRTASKLKPGKLRRTLGKIRNLYQRLKVSLKGYEVLPKGAQKSPSVSSQPVALGKGQRALPVPAGKSPVQPAPLPAAEPHAQPQPAAAAEGFKVENIGNVEMVPKSELELKVRIAEPYKSLGPAGYRGRGEYQTATGKELEKTAVTGISGRKKAATPPPKPADGRPKVNKPASEKDSQEILLKPDTYKEMDALKADFCKALGTDKIDWAGKNISVYSGGNGYELRIGKHRARITFELWNEVNKLRWEAQNAANGRSLPAMKQKSQGERAAESRKASRRRIRKTLALPKAARADRARKFALNFKIPEGKEGARYLRLQTENGDKIVALRREGDKIVVFNYGTNANREAIIVALPRKGEPNVVVDHNGIRFEFKPSGCVDAGPKPPMRMSSKRSAPPAARTERRLFEDPVPQNNDTVARWHPKNGPNGTIANNDPMKPHRSKKEGTIIGGPPRNWLPVPSKGTRKPPSAEDLRSANRPQNEPVKYNWAAKRVRVSLNHKPEKIDLVSKEGRRVETITVRIEGVPAKIYRIEGKSVFEVKEGILVQVTNLSRVPFKIKRNGNTVTITPHSQRKSKKIRIGGEFKDRNIQVRKETKTQPVPLRTLIRDNILSLIPEKVKQNFRITGTKILINRWGSGKGVIIEGGNKDYRFCIKLSEKIENGRKVLVVANINFEDLKASFPSGREALPGQRKPGFGGTEALIRGLVGIAKNNGYSHLELIAQHYHNYVFYKRAGFGLKGLVIPNPDLEDVRNAREVKALDENYKGKPLSLGDRSIRAKAFGEWPMPRMILKVK